MSADSKNELHIPQTREARESLKARHKEFFAAVSMLMFERDPIEINFENNTDEYESEAGTVIPRLHGCQSPQDVQHILHEEFCRWFDDETAGPVDNYRALAQDIWNLMARMNWRSSAA